jgi:hypothetical protein
MHWRRQEAPEEAAREFGGVEVYTNPTDFHNSPKVETTQCPLTEEQINDVISTPWNII